MKKKAVDVKELIDRLIQVLNAAPALAFFLSSLVDTYESPPKVVAKKATAGCCPEDEVDHMLCYLEAQRDELAYCAWENMRLTTHLEECCPHGG